MQKKTLVFRTPFKEILIEVHNNKKTFSLRKYELSKKFSKALRTRPKAINSERMQFYKIRIREKSK